MNTLARTLPGVVCAPALAVLDTIGRQARWSRCDHRAHLKQGLHDLGPVVADVRGAGLLVDSGPDGDRAVDVQQAAREQGVLVNAVAPDVIRLAPPLTVSADDVDGFLDRFAPVLREAAGPQPAAA